MFFVRIFHNDIHKFVFIERQREESSTAYRRNRISNYKYEEINRANRKLR